VASNDWQARFTAKALGRVDDFIAAHPGLTRQGVQQPPQGSTNRVFFARRGEELLVFKVFCERQRKERECFALRHWGDTGLTPKLIWDVDPTMIVTSHVPGLWLSDARKKEGEEAWRGACRQVGRAVGLLTRVPMSVADRTRFESAFYGELGALESYLGRILDLGRSVHQRDEDFRDGFWKRSLAFIAAELPGILRQPRVLYHQDVANLHVQQGRLMGFFDLEMCRAGCAAMQLGSAMGMVETDPEAWPFFREGWAAATGKALTARDAAAAAAARQLLGWREITRYISYDGTPGSGFEWAAPADPARYRSRFEATDRLLEIGVF
jgi:hypothetical protein